MKPFTNKTRADIWQSIRRGVENGEIKDHETAIRAVYALMSAHIVIHSERTLKFAEKFADQRPSSNELGSLSNEFAQTSRNRLP